MQVDTRSLLILGAGTFAVEVGDLVSEVPGFKLEGFVQNLDPQQRDQTLEGLPVYWVGDLGDRAATHWAVCAVGAPQRRTFIGQLAAAGMRFATVVHPAARVSVKSSLGEGCIVSAGAIVGAHTRVGRHVILNRGVLVGHHTELGDYVTVGPGANIAGLCKIGDCASIGMGAIIKDHLNVGSGAVVGPGAVVVKNVPDQVTIVAPRPLTIDQK